MTVGRPNGPHPNRARLSKRLTVHATERSCASLRCVFQNSFSFDHLVGTGEEPVRNREAERLRSLQIDRQAEARRLLERQVRRLRSFENAINKGCYALEALVLIRPIGHQATITNEEIKLVDGR